MKIVNYGSSTDFNNEMIIECFQGNYQVISVNISNLREHKQINTKA
jgi:hypothetical protein